jgi:hypothetical protein
MPLTQTDLPGMCSLHNPTGQKFGEARATCPQRKYRLAPAGWGGGPHFNFGNLLPMFRFFGEVSPLCIPRARGLCARAVRARGVQAVGVVTAIVTLRNEV